MRHSNQRGTQSPQYRARRRPYKPSAQKWSALNCIVDEGALLAGLVDSTDPEDNLKTWVREGAINVFVPLYTLEMLNMLRSSPPPLNLNARTTLEWLDHITSVTENKSAGHVELQGPDDQYQTWSEVEKYLLPETPLSSNNDQGGIDSVIKTVESNLSLDDSQELDDPGDENSYSPTSASYAGSASPPSSPKKNFASSEMETTANHNRDISHSSVISNHSTGLNTTADPLSSSAHGTRSIPSRVRPLLNYVVWRTHHEEASKIGSGKYILLTNDPKTRKQAQQFGVRAKLLTQLRFIVARGRNKVPGETHNEHDNVGRGGSRDRDHAKDQVNGPRSKESIAEPINDDKNEEGEDEVVFSPRRPNSSQMNSPTPKVWDPDHFGRMPIQSGPSSSTAPAQELSQTQNRGPSSPRRPGSGRGGGQSRTYRGKDSQGSVRGPARGGGSANGNGPRQKIEKPIDPDSFDRPLPAGRRGRGTYRRLWEPTG